MTNGEIETGLEILAMTALIAVYFNILLSGLEKKVEQEIEAKKKDKDKR